MSARRWLPAALVAPLSLVLIVAVDDGVWALLHARQPSLAVLAAVRLPSLALTYALCLVCGGRRALARPARPRPLSRALVPSLAWLGGAAVADFLARVWVPRICGAVDTIAFMGTGLVGEELLFRGAVWSATEQATSRRYAPLVVSSVTYALSHVAFHHFQLTSAAWTQVAYTLVLGLILGLLRDLTRSLWPGVALHLANNALALAAARLWRCQL